MKLAAGTASASACAESSCWRTSAITSAASCSGGTSCGPSPGVGAATESYMSAAWPVATARLNQATERTRASRATVPVPCPAATKASMAVIASAAPRACRDICEKMRKFESSHGLPGLLSTGARGIAMKVPMQ